jgi:hypothetical protein
MPRAESQYVAEVVRLPLNQQIQWKREAKSELSRVPLQVIPLRYAYFPVKLKTAILIAVTPVLMLGSGTG